jgi:hypothetical protein
MDDAAGYAGGQGTCGQIWEQVWQGALVGGVSSAAFGVGNYPMGSGAPGTGRINVGEGCSGSTLASSLAARWRLGPGTRSQKTDWEAVLVAGGISAAIGGFSRFGGGSGLPVLNVLKPKHVRIASSTFAQVTGLVVVLHYADGLCRFLHEHRVSQATGGEVP